MTKYKNRLKEVFKDLIESEGLSFKVLETNISFDKSDEKVCFVKFYIPHQKETANIASFRYVYIEEREYFYISNNDSRAPLIHSTITESTTTFSIQTAKIIINALINDFKKQVIKERLS